MDRIMRHKHEQIEINESSFLQFILMNGFNESTSRKGNYFKGRLNVSFHRKGFSIMGEYKDYPKTFKKVCKRFFEYEPSWEWRYISVYDKEF